MSGAIAAPGGRGLSASRTAFAALVLGGLAAGLDPGWRLIAGMSAVTVLTVLSGAAYLAIWLRHMAG